MSTDPVRHLPNPVGVTPDGRHATAEPNRPGLLRKVWQFLKVLQARMRFLVILAAVGGVIVYWETLETYCEKWTRPLHGAEAAADPTTEFWCPMHPTIIRDGPDKCPIYAMPLSKRKKGEGGGEEALPAGVVSRVQLTPYRVALAGVRTWEVGYRPMFRDIIAVGFVEFDERKLARITSRATGKSRIDKLHVNVTGQMVKEGEPLAELYSPDLVVTVQNLLDARTSGNPHLERMARERLRLWGIDDNQIDGIVRTGKPITQVTIRSPISGHVIRKYRVEGEYVEEGSPLYDVADLSTVWIEAQVYEDELAFVKEGLPVQATTRAFPGRIFQGRVAFLHPHLDTATRTLKVRFDVDNPERDLRPGMYATVRLSLPATELDSFADKRRETCCQQTAIDLMAHALLSPGHPRAGAGLASLLSAGMAEAAALHKQVLAIPEPAVIDTGTRSVVYREVEPGTFEGVSVELGPRAGGFYPVVRGLAAGDRVVTAGSFLIDAETRLTAGVASTYFGASAGPQGNDPSATASARPSMVEDEEAGIQAALSRLRPDDRRRAEAQQYCPILPGSRLGSMGRPVRIFLDDQPVYLCCKGCVEKAREHPDRTLAKVAELKAGGTSGGRKAPLSEDPEEAAEIGAALGKLSPADRKLAEAQGYCAVAGEHKLGSMGTPIKVLVNGEPAFICCEGCKEAALESPARTLRTVRELKARRKVGASEE